MKGTFQRLMGYTLAHRRTLLIAVVLLLLATAADVMGPLLIKHFIDTHLMPANWAVADIALLVLGYLTANLVGAWLGYHQLLLWNQIAQRVVLTLRHQIFARLMHLPLRRFDYTPAGSLISRITNDTEAVKELFVGVLGVYIQNSVRVLGIFVAMAVLDWRLMLACLVFLPAVVLVMYTYRRLSTPIYQRARELLSDINAQMNEMLQGVSVIQLFAQERHFAAQYAATTQDHFTTRRRTLQLDALLLRPMVDMLQLCTLVGLLYLFAGQALQTPSAPLQVGVIYAFLSYLGRFTEPLIEMTQRLSLFQQAIVSANRVFAWIDEPEEQTGSAAASADCRGALQFQAVDFGYDARKPVLRGVNLTVQPGEFVGIVGHTGSGKSTLASLLLRFYPPVRGRILLAGRDLATLSHSDLRRHIAIVQQDSFVLAASVADNIAIGRPLDRQAVEAAARAVGLHQQVLAMPQGYDTLLDEKGQSLSVGQRQLLSLARAMAGKPQILVLDEATANVDSATEQVVQQSLLALRGQVTLLVIAHRLSTLTQADRIVVLHQGEIVQQGSHRALLTQDGLYRHLYELQRAKQWSALREAEPT